MADNSNMIAREDDIEKVYQKASDDYLREALNRSYKERFLYATMLYKVQNTMKKAKIVHKKTDK